MCTNSQLYIHHLYVCVCVCECGSYVALTTGCRFSFCLPLEPERTHTNAGAEIGKQRQDEAQHCTGLFRTTPTALPPAFIRQAGSVGWWCWYDYREGREKCVSSVLRKWLNCWTLCFFRVQVMLWLQVTLRWIQLLSCQDFDDICLENIRIEQPCLIRRLMNNMFCLEL